MPFNKHSPYRSSLIILAVILVFVFISPGFFQSFRVGIGRAVTVPAGILAGPVHELKKFLLYHQTYDDYQALKLERDSLRSRLVNFEETLQENKRLTALLGLRRMGEVSTAAARVIGRDLSGWESSVLIDKGLKDGIKKGAPVIAAGGVVGRVAGVSEYSSRVMLLIDPQFSVAGRVRTNQQSVLVSGSLNGLCRIRYVQAQDSIRIGDEIVTSLMSSSFPGNIMIGKVIDVRPGADGGTEFVVKPAVDTSNLQEMLIIIGENDLKRPTS